MPSYTFQCFSSKSAISTADIWGMVAFAFIAFIMTLGGTYAAIESNKIKVEEPWSSIDVNSIK